MVSVIIPVLNEAATVGSVVRICKASPVVDEIIVVDDKSTDDSAKKAAAAGAHVVTSTRIGKGASMRDGLFLSKSDAVVFLDGDVEYPADTIEKLTAPVLSDKADFVKGTFSRQAGRVTELVAKPLLTLLYPELAVFSQPLSGVIAGKRSFLERIVFENDYGVDVGILIDMWSIKARIAETHIGNIQNKMKMWRELASMSRDVSRAILKRLTGASLVNLDSLGEIAIIRNQMEYAIQETLKQLKKIIVFDMDNTLLQGRFIETAAHQLGFKEELYDVVAAHQEPYLTTKLIARFMKGNDISRLLRIADLIPLVEDAQAVIGELKKRGYITGIITDSYDVIANHIKLKTGIDFTLANELEFSNSVATGEVKIPSFFMRNEKSVCNHTYCKTHALLYLTEKYSIPISNVIAVGDSSNDVCMVKKAGVGVAFYSNNSLLNSIADQKIEERSFVKLMEIAL